VDARQFDGIAKTLSSGTDRRRVLGGLAVGALAGLFGWHEADAAECAKEGQKPNDDKACCFAGPLVDDRCPAQSIPLLGTCFQCECFDSGKVCAPVYCTGSEAGTCAEEATPCTCKIGPV
jgi:hypothetical protein